MQEKMNILCVANKNYIEPMKVFLYSLFEHHECAMDVYVLHVKISMDMYTGSAEKAMHSHTWRHRAEELDKDLLSTL